MPDQLAHYLFAKRVWEACPELKTRIDPASAAFRVGSFGPDPLFNDFSAAHRRQGFGVHRRPGREALEKLRVPMMENWPAAADYAAGFFLHYALDRLCHPGLKEMDARGDAKHVPTETAYDRVLYLRGGVGMPGKLLPGSDACRVAVQVYEGIAPEQFRRDVRDYWYIRRMLMRGGGTLLSKLPDKLNPAWQGIIPHGTPSAGTIRGIAMLDRLMEASVPVAAEQLLLYFRALDGGLPLDNWTDADFSGRLHK